MKEIRLTKGYVALVDDIDFEEMNKYKWFYHCGYAMRNSSRGNGKRCGIFMHRIINNTPEGLETDHINGNALDNSRINLRSCTHSQNIKNQGKQRTNLLGVKGVYICIQKRGSKIYKSIRSQISVNGEKVYLGTFKTIEEASQAYNEASKKYHGQFGRGF